MIQTEAGKENYSIGQ